MEYYIIFITDLIVNDIKNLFLLRNFNFPNSIV